MFEHVNWTEVIYMEFVNMEISIVWSLGLVAHLHTPFTLP